MGSVCSISTTGIRTLFNFADLATAIPVNSAITIEIAKAMNILVHEYAVSSITEKIICNIQEYTAIVLNPFYLFKIPF